MKQQWLIPLCALFGGFTAFVLRLIQNRTGFSSGLPIPGAPAALALTVFLVVLAVLLLLLSRTLSGPETLPPPAGTPALLLLPTLGASLLALSGAADLYEGFTRANLLEQIRDLLPAPEIPTTYYNPIGFFLSTTNSNLSAQLQALCGALMVLGAWASLCLLALFRPGRARQSQSFPNQFLLFIPLAQMTRLLVFYRRDCVNPILEEYAVNLLALSFLTLSAFALISFVFCQGSYPRFAFYAAAAAILCLCSLADQAERLSSLLLCLGGPLLTLGFLLLFLCANGTETVPETDGGTVPGTDGGAGTVRGTDGAENGGV